MRKYLFVSVILFCGSSFWIHSQISDRQVKEQIEWLNIEAIERAHNDVKQMPGYGVSINEQRLMELRAICEAGFKGIHQGDALQLERGRKALQLKRDILLANPLLDFDKLVVGRFLTDKPRSKGAPMLGTEPNNWSNHTSGNQSGFNAEIAELSGLRSEPQWRTIFRPQEGVPISDFKLHWNGDRMLFSMPQPGDHHWQIYEIRSDGSRLRQITFGGEEDLDFFDGCYLPNGKLIVTSTIGGQGVPCVHGSDQVGNLCLFDPNTKAMRRLTFDQDANWVPTVMNNGRVMYVRWEYTDLTHYFSRIVMHCNPDGTEQRALYGSGSVFPTSIYDVVPLPNHSTRFVGIISGHHGVARSGRLIIFDPAISRKEEKGMVQELPFSKRPIVPIIKDEMVNGVFPQFLKPQPLSNDYFIVTAKLSGSGLWGIYLIDIFDNLTLIAELEEGGLIYGIPLRKTPTPPVIPNKTNLDSKQATVFIQNIYEGEGLQGVKQGSVKELRVFAYEYAFVKSISDHTAQGIQSGWDIKRLLGTVPVEADGSVMFKIPANTPISLQPVDDAGGAIQWMRSWLTGQPGETVSCVGCHEDQNQIPVPKKSLASMKMPQFLTPPEGGVRSFTFDLEIQPLLDRNCVKCHDGTKQKMDFTGGQKDKNGYGKSYLSLHPFIHRQGPEAGMKVLYPYEYHYSNSVLIRTLKNGHYGVKLSDKEWRALFNWIDFNAPDKGTFASTQWSGGDQYSRRIALNNKYSNGISVDWKKELKEYAAYLEQQPPIVSKQVSNKEESRGGSSRKRSTKMQPIASIDLTQADAFKMVTLADGIVIRFVRIPEGTFYMGKDQDNCDYWPAHKVVVRKSFWMSEKEISNEQLQLFIPTHDSRYVDQQWKDHVNEGYPAFLPKLSASRVSYHEANEFCDIASKKTGLKIMLPTELQWEWACRAGTDTDFWYGTLNSDFSDKENLADKQTLKLAVIGVDPQPMSENHGWYPYFTWLPKMESVDDGQMIVSESGLYHPNLFGLYDMHGNVAEWTRSDYFPYPYNLKKQGKGSRKVVRGGSWKEHPKYSTSFYRKAFLPEQRPFNVGFRVIIEE